MVADLPFLSYQASHRQAILSSGRVLKETDCQAVKLEGGRSHLPQIAALAPTHFAIDKSVRGPRTVTSVTRLDEPGREREIARMMAGEAAASESVLAGAKALIAQAKAKGETRPGAKAKGRR